MKNILIISDNLKLCDAVSKLDSLRAIPDTDWHFGISPKSSVDDFIKTLGRKVSQLNLKDEATVKRIVQKYQVVISLHCKQLFPSQLTNSVRCINVHPGYNPINRGWFPQVFAIIHGLPVGVTIHEIDEEIDHGKIILREYVKIENTDTSKSLYDKLLDKEIELLEKNIENIITGNYVSFEPENEGNLYLKKDFDALCELNLNERVSYRECINKMRALTHNGHKNLFFRDDKTGEKIFITISLEK